MDPGRRSQGGDCRKQEAEADNSGDRNRWDPNKGRNRTGTPIIAAKQLERIDFEVGHPEVKNIRMDLPPINLNQLKLDNDIRPDLY